MRELEKIKIPENLRHEKEFVVKSENLAKFLGSGNVNVLATPWLIAWMENTAREATDKYLPEGYTTVGYRVDIKHLNPAPLESRVKVTAELKSIEGRKLTFEVKATLGDIVIGEGVHERYIIDVNKFREKTSRIQK